MAEIVDAKNVLGKPATPFPVTIQDIRMISGYAA